MIVYYEDYMGLDFAINKKVRFCPYRAESFIFSDRFSDLVWTIIKNVFTFYIYFLVTFVYEYLRKS